MEIFMTNISWAYTRVHVTNELVAVLHSPPYTSHLYSMNFYVRLFKDKKVPYRNHSGSGVLTLPTKEVADLFLSEYGAGQGEAFDKSIYLGGRKVRFAPSRRTPNREVLEVIRRTSFLSPENIDEQVKRTRAFNAEHVSIRELQFGWECRDDVFSIESKDYMENTCVLCFNEERRELQIRMSQIGEIFIIAIRFSHIQYLSAHVALSTDPVIYISLEVPPSYERETNSRQPRQRLSHIPIIPDHQRIAPYCSLCIRLICCSHSDLVRFRELYDLAQLHTTLANDFVEVGQRRLFSQDAIETLEESLQTLDWAVAFQVEALVKGKFVDIREMLEILPSIRRLVGQKGKEFAAAVLRRFKSRVMTLAWDPNTETDVLQCFLATEAECLRQPAAIELLPTGTTLFRSLHVTVTPTTIYCDGPFAERSNRVIRSYMEQQDSFIRVNFVDEGGLQFRFDRDIDCSDFIRKRIGLFLLHGLKIAGRMFHFLAYSQSALKEHAVWFVKPFYDKEGNYVDAEAIINSLGVFKELPFDSKLIYCPARYAARLSQAFTATDVSVSVDVEEVFYEDDICTISKESKEYCFTDGVGTLSKELAHEIAKGHRRRKHASRNVLPRAFQIRLMGSKGMLSVDYKLQGRAVVLRPSMIKFSAPESRQIEIARAFDRPTPYFLNRPLIMLLEGLGVPYEVFEYYQRKTIEETQRSTETLEHAARLFEGHGLGMSFRLTSVLLSLDKLGLDTLSGDTFFERVLEYAVYHILRELKNHARIPIPDAWTLVGIADIHNYLQENEIFACVKPPYSAAQYLEGPVLISRSPTIHPGDAQLAYAVGKPPENSCFAIEPLPNTVVFSVKGDRPLPSALGGGDLDGDMYNVLPLQSLPGFTPTHTHKPAEYAPAQKKLLDRPSTMTDVAEFVMEYINSDVVGIIAINWLIIADQSPKGILDQDCLTLAELHSDAVDYPKSGMAVALNKIPKLKAGLKPDWNAPETVDMNSSKYYPSQRAIGKLFRDVELPKLKVGSRVKRHRARRPLRSHEPTNQLADSFSDLNFNFDNDLQQIVRERVEEFINLDDARNQQELEHIAQLFTQYVEDLSNICATHTLSRSQRMLTEQEAMVGTILQRTSQPRKRKDTMSKLREQTDILVRGIRAELEGDQERTSEAFLQRSWLAWELASLRKRSKEFGAESFAWVSLGAIFEAIRDVEEEMDENR